VTRLAFLEPSDESLGYFHAALAGVVGTLAQLPSRFREGSRIVLLLSGLFSARFRR
jgi:hypothetical protein